MGNAPSVGGLNMFCNADATIYYLPESTGWEPTFAGRPTVLWNPSIQTADENFGIRPNGFGFNIIGTTNIPIVIEACTNLASGVWLPLCTTNLTDTAFDFTDSEWANHPRRFYRIRWPQ